MGLFGNVGDNVNTLRDAFRKLFEDRSIQGFGRGSLILCKEVMRSTAGSVASIFQSLKHGVSYLASGHENDQMIPEDLNNGMQALQSLSDKELFEDDIGQAELGQFSSPLLLVDTQNKIWLKINSR